MKNIKILSVLFTILLLMLTNSKPIVAQVFEGDITLSSQAEVDAFMRTEITGNLIISGNDITNLNSLSTLNACGSLRIENNPELSNIDGLSNLISIRNGLSIVNGGLSIKNNDKLIDVDALANVQAIGSFFDFAMEISDNEVLKNLDNFSSLTTVNGDIAITDNPSLETINGFSSISEHHGSIFIFRNEALKSINGFNGLVSLVSRSFFAPSGLSFNIGENKSLAHIDGFSSLITLDGVQGGAFISIFDNPALKDFNGLSSISTIRSITNQFNAVRITNNATLENIDGLSGLRHSINSGLLEIIITNNPLLNNCCGLSQYISSGGGNITFAENGAGGGCTTENILACGDQRVSSFTLLNHQTHEVIQNFQNEMTIDLADPRFSNLMLQANTFPQQVGSVEFIFDGHIRRTENGFPYQFILPQFTPGIHTTRAEVYSEHQLKGEKGIGRTATFNVINSATVISFDVVNQARQTLMNLHDGDEINIKDPAFKTFLFRANTVPDHVSKVELFLNNQLVAIEYGFPYEVYGNPSPGDYTLEAIPYIKIRVIGNEYVPGTSLKISFKVVSEDPGSSSQLVMNDQSNKESLLKVSESPGVTIFPVPVDSELNIKIDDAPGKDPLITIRTIHGLTVYQDFYSKSQSINTLPLQAGVYYLQVAGYGGFQKVVKFIKK